MSDNDHIYKMVDELKSQQSETNSELRNLSQKIGDLVTVFARKEAHDENMQRRIDDHDNRLNNHSERLNVLENVQAGQKAEQKIMDWILRAGITAVVGVVLYGAFKMYGG